jgi:type IV secretory pathway component VirB8
MSVNVWTDQQSNKIKIFRKLNEILNSNENSLNKFIFGKWVLLRIEYEYLFKHD